MSAGGTMQVISNLDDRILRFLQKDSSYILVYTNSQAKQHGLNKQWTYIWQPWLSLNGICLQKRGWGFLSTLVFFFMGCQCMKDLPQC